MTRKNALSAGSDGGAGPRTVVASLGETCTLIGVDPQADLADVMIRIVDRHSPTAAATTSCPGPVPQSPPAEPSPKYSSPTLPGYKDTPGE